uniref:DNA topoisomerase 2 n=1 Tax=Theileria annulata TaxID=5874 RepID=A0A3B0MNB7_THEAN
MGKAKTVEERYQKKTQLEHILLRPDTYIGSTELNNQQMWLYDEEKNRMVYETIDYVPGLYKIFDELLVNAADVYARQLSDPTLEKMTCIKVTIDRGTGAIVVYNDGEPIPIQIHSEHKMYVPQLIFGELLTSDNYDDSEERVTGGRNGFGAKLANIFSKTFTVVVGNKKTHKKFKMTWCNNMTKTKSPAHIESYTGPDFVKITFIPDYSRFNLEELDEGTYRVLKKRVYDMAGTLGVKVYLNNERIKVKDFKDYVNLYLPEDATEIVKIYEKMYRWEVVISSSEDGFRQVSFVNSINTLKGGTHVSHVVDPLVQSLTKKVNSKNKGGIELKPNQIRNHIFVFINCQIVNPSFDSQTKETLTTKIVKFGSKYTMSDKTLNQVLKSKIFDNIISWLHEKTNIELKKKMKVAKGNDKLFGIPKLEDANKAGTRYATECTLILTEGDSAKTSCLAGLSVVGRDKYGVFPLKGKLLNVREASYKQLTQNIEVQNILKIMGLDITNKLRQDSSGLRYGSIMIMTDQDYDGSHIKGLLINMFHNFWPKLIQFNGFIKEFITPIIKVTNKSNNQVHSFFTIEDFNNWKQTVDISNYRVKYYKGLGTSSDNEFKEYFGNLNRHIVEFKYVDTVDDDSIDLAFSKKRIDDRKKWMQNYVLGTTVDHSIKKLRYSDFINKELIQFSIYDTERSIPSVIDGFKPGQRKVLFGCFKRNLKNECKVAQLTGYIAEHSAYHHGENSLQQTIINMAQDYVGSNNINLLLPCGQFGSRKEGGKDAAAARYIFTKLSPLTRYIFLQEDDPILDYQNDDGQIIEPYYYLPIIPMVLVNGAEGIGTGFSTFIPSYNPIDIIDNIVNFLDNKDMNDMIPWYRNFKGTVTRNSKLGYDIIGNYELNHSINQLVITELPINRWTNDYREYLNSIMATNKEDEGYITDYGDFSSNEFIKIKIKLNDSGPDITDDIEKVFKLKTTISTSNMILFDCNKRIKKYNGAIDILKDFITTRVKYYTKRREYMIKQLQLQLQQLSNQIRFINMIINNELVIFRKSKKQIVSELKRLNFNTYKPEEEEDEEDNDIEGFNYLLKMSLLSLTLDHINKLNNEYNSKQIQLKELINTTPIQLYKKDLIVLKEQLVQTKQYKPYDKRVKLQPEPIVSEKVPETRRVPSLNGTTPSTNGVTHSTNGIAVNNSIPHVDIFDLTEHEEVDMEKGDEVYGSSQYEDNFQLSQLELSQVNPEEFTQSNTEDSSQYIPEFSSQTSEKEPNPLEKYSTSLLDRLNKKYNSNVLTSIINTDEEAKTPPSKPIPKQVEKTPAKSSNSNSGKKSTSIKRKISSKLILSSDEDSTPPKPARRTKKPKKIIEDEDESESEFELEDDDESEFELDDD